MISSSVWFISYSVLMSFCCTVAISNTYNSSFSFVFLQINFDLIDRFLKSSSLIKTTFIWALIFWIEESFDMHFFTVSSAPSIMFDFIFSLSVWFSCLSSLMITSSFFSNWIASFAFLSAASIFPRSSLWSLQIYFKICNFLIGFLK